MVISSRFQSTADRPDPGLKATDERGPGPGRAVAASAGAVTPATTAAVATRTRAFPILRMRAAPLDWVGWRHRPARDPGRAGRGYLLSRLVRDGCSLKGRARGRRVTRYLGVPARHAEPPRCDRRRQGHRRG